MQSPSRSAPPELTILMPCLNEALSLETCILMARRFIESSGVDTEILIADNGSTDGSQEIAERLGARVVAVTRKGYGSALAAGIAAADGRYIIMGDADGSYDFQNLMPFMEKLRDGYDLVMGNRFRGGIKPGAMPFLHRYLGNPVLSAIGRLFFGSPCKDFHCGLRGFSRAAILSLKLRTTGMEFATEMVVRATLSDFKITEVPTTLSPDLRDRAPHLRTWRDGWRHLQFLLLYSPRWLFLYPGIASVCVGIFALVWLGPKPRQLGFIDVELDVHTLLYAAVAVILGFQMTLFAVIGKVYSASRGLTPRDRKFTFISEQFSLNRSLIVGFFVMALGVLGTVLALRLWSTEHFGALQPAIVMRAVIPSALCLVIGFQIVFAGFFLGLLKMGSEPN